MIMWSTQNVNNKHVLLTRYFLFSLYHELTIRSIFYAKKYCFQVLQYFSHKSIAILHAILNVKPVLQYLLQY